ncbi:alpha-ketoglutarate-dependent dioxygenase alkB homolog 4 [Anabrus simplex]|uniref:alpha-ketoglutarate-dependent dioxygenase alkB homolog 4 n=1 Tax=Anabrus simplex TaxID=316456 RepID=UPI0034DCF792
MDKPRPCGCKGIRTCLICENEYGIQKEVPSYEDVISYVYCPACNMAWPGWDVQIIADHPNHAGTAIHFPGVYILLNFLSVEEESYLMKGIDEMPWDLSQSGRRKQNFGPKCNFKKQRLKVGDFHGFPSFTKFVQEKFDEVPILQNYRVIEQCSLEYDPLRGASIDPHIDDCWIWGERIVTVNLLSDSVLTMTRYCGDPGRYNLKCVSMYPRVLDDSGSVVFDPSDCEESSTICNEYNASSLVTFNVEKKEKNFCPLVRVPMPRRSLLVLYGEARYLWEHSILREDVQERRVCLAYREFTPPYFPNGKDASQLSNNIFTLAKTFW